MAGNIVKWWRQFKQYKQFSVLQECTTDSEELIYQAPSSCGAPPDLLMTSNQSQPPQMAPAPEPQTQPKPVKVVKVKDHHGKERLSQEAAERLAKRHSIATTRHLEALEENRVHLNEFTCDVSLEESSKKPQPIQFSFTLYDLDGHGKITKDDIGSIVSTIYDSIGKTVVVPHYGKKTINVKLTVSPDAKRPPQPSANEQNHHTRATKKLQLTPRRRYRARALLSDDDDDDASESTSENIAPLPKMQNEITHNSIKTGENLNNDKNNVYESFNNLKCCNQSHTIDNLLTTKNNKNIEIYKNCQPSHSPDHLHIEEEDVNFDTKCQQKHVPSSKRKLLRKSRVRRQRPSEARVRSLSVGNEHKWRRQQLLEEKTEEFVTAKDCQLNNSTNLRRDELIEIIKDSMEKNRLCFQANRKPENVSGATPMRQRSNTVTCTNKLTVGKAHCTDFDQQHLCAFDSFLHATICTNAHPTSPDLAKIHAAKMNNRNKMKQMNQSMPPALKLKTSVLNQLNPNLTAEQKLTRKLNDVEKWLLERETTNSYKIDEGKVRDKNILNPIVIDKLSAQATSTPKKVFNKEVLITRKLKPLGHQSKQQKEVINSSKNQIMLEYSNVPVPGDTSECENLLISDDEAPTAIHVNTKANDVTREAGTASNASDSTTKSSSVRFVHIHHHFYHFNENEC